MPNNGKEKVLTRSVTHDDVLPYQGNGVVNFLYPAFGGVYVTTNVLPPELPQPATVTPFSKARDITLLSTLRAEGYWSNAVHIAMSKLISRGYAFESPVPNRVNFMNELFRVCDGRRGFARYLARHLQDYYLTNNGAWTEIERVARNPYAKIISFHHLDSLRVWATGDPEIPAIYWDLRGKYHELRWYEVFRVVDMDSPRSGFWWGGLCAAERAYYDIRAMQGMNQYFDEKIFGAGYNELEFVNGVTYEQIRQAKEQTEAENQGRGAILFNGKLVVPVFSEMPVSGYRVPLKGLPDDWKRQEEFDLRLLNYANTMGIAPFQLDPRLTARGSMGIGRQSQILDESEQGRGSGSWEKSFIGAVNDYLAPSETVMMMITVDLRDEELRAKNALVRAQAREADVKNGVLTPDQALFNAIAAGDAPREFLNDSAAIPEKLSDMEKPISGRQEMRLGQEVDKKAPPPQALPTGAKTMPPIQTKAVDAAHLLWLQELGPAAQIAQAAQTYVPPSEPQVNVTPTFNLVLPDNESVRSMLKETATDQANEAVGGAVKEMGKALAQLPAPIVTVNTPDTKQMMEELVDRLIESVAIQKPPQVSVNTPATDNSELIAALRDLVQELKAQKVPQVTVAPAPVVDTVMDVQRDAAGNIVRIIKHNR